MLTIMRATGNIGSKLADRLLDKNRRVKVIGRSADRLQPFVDRGATAAVGDASDSDFLSQAFSGSKAVFAMIPPDYECGAGLPAIPKRNRLADRHGN